jgi:hypothetical protein
MSWCSGLVWLLVAVSRTVASGPSPPRIETSPIGSLVVNISDPVTLECRVSGEPAPGITWFKNNEPISMGGRYTMIRSSDLFIISAAVGRGDKSDSGVYHCEASNKLGVAKSQNSSLLVAFLKQDFREIPKSRQVNSGTPVAMECIAPRGSPEPVIWWEKNGMPLEHRSQMYSTFQNGTFLIHNATLVDNGDYRCVAQNDAGVRRSAPAYLNVFAKPMFLIRPETRKYEAQSVVKLECQADGFPKPLIEWKKDNSIDNIPLK